VINEMAEKYAIDYRTLIMEVSKINKENPTAELIESVAQSIRGMANAGVYYPKTYQNKS
jgi:dihydroneopterin aldolase